MCTVARNCRCSGVAVLHCTSWRGFGPAGDGEPGHFNDGNGACGRGSSDCGIERLGEKSQKSWRSRNGDRDTVDRWAHGNYPCSDADIHCQESAEKPREESLREIT